MANDLRTRATVELQIANSDKVQSRIDDINRSLSDVSKSARSMDFSNADKSVQALESSMRALAESGEDCTQEWAQFERASKSAYKSLESAAVKLNHSISEQGKLQRERIKELEAERAGLGQTREEKARAKEIERELKELRKDVVDASDDELKSMLRLNVQARARLRIMQNEAKQQKTQAKQQKTLKQLIAEDLKPLKEKLKLQKEFIQSLKTTEGRYNALKKSAKAAFSVGKTALKGAGVVAGAALGIAGAAIGAGEGQVSRADQVRRIKAGQTSGEKRKLLDEVFIEAGGSNEEVVDAINRVYSVLGKDASLEDVKTAAAMELKYPGLTKLFMQQNVGKVGASDYVAAANRTGAIQAYSGATKEQIASASDYISNLRQSKFTNASQLELRDLYLALLGSGGFDTEEELQRAFNSFVRQQMKSNVDVFSLAKQWQAEGKWTRTAYGATNRTQAANAVRNIDFGMLATNNRMLDYTKRESGADSAAKTARRVSILKDQLLVELLKGLEPLLKNGDLQKLVSMVLRAIQSGTFQKMVNMVGELLGAILQLVGKIAKIVSPFAQGAIDAILDGAKSAMNFLSGKEDGDSNAPDGGTVGQARANGGIASMPSVFGEGVYPEMAIPLDPAREGRAQQLTAYVQNHFNMSGNETSSLALAGALNSREWAYQSSRIGQLNRRLGR